MRVVVGSALTIGLVCTRYSTDSWLRKTNPRQGLGHVRLSIVDLSSAGNQPFHDSEGAIHAVVNGELYDHEEHRTELAQEYDFKSNSDCEIVIALYRHYGISFLNKLRGEFALVLYDANRKLFLTARDRYGIKSLYYTMVGNRLLVATEMKSFLPFGWKPEWDVTAIREGAWMNGSQMFFKGVQRVRTIYIKSLECDKCYVYCCLGLTTA